MALHRRKKDHPKFTRPAIYKITVDGVLNENMPDIISDLQISVDRSEPDEPVSILVGWMEDQTALSGVLNTIYENHYIIISVKMLKERHE